MRIELTTSYKERERRPLLFAHPCLRVNISAQFMKAIWLINQRQLIYYSLVMKKDVRQS